MKYKITFEIDATGTSYEIKDRNDEVDACLMNLGQWLYQLHLHFLEHRVQSLGNAYEQKLSPEMIEAIKKHDAEQLKLSEQLFNNYTVEGVMTDGTKFTFTHKEPGYKEEMTYHE